MERFEEIFKIFSFFDDYRWQNKENYNLINFYRDDLDDDTKILTHWLCYISDRQMDFELIWDVGGFVYSEMVNEIKRIKDVSIIKPEIEDSFVKKDNDGKYYFISKKNANDKIMKNYEDNINKNKVKFKSRFVPADYFCILSTFVILEKFNYNLSEYISYVYLKNKDKDDIIIRLLYSLYLLSYYEIGQPNSDDLKNYEENLNKVILRKEMVLFLINNSELFDEQLKIFKKDKMFKQKRAWCSLRDFIKSNEFFQYFKNAMLKYISEENILSLRIKKCLEQFVLPGDVWNNNSIFGKCILEKTSYEHSKKSLNVILDDYFKKAKPKIGYPEQFDVTFDFVPRMCRKNNCNICPIKNIDLENNIEKICVNDIGKYCTVALSSCNYKGYCVGKEKCKLFDKM
jgi:hypothetical protein